MKRILVMESGSLRKGYQAAGAVKASYQLYSYLKQIGEFEVDAFADFSLIDQNAKSISKKDLLSKDYDAILMNSIRDVVIINGYMKGHKNAKAIYTDRGNVLTNQRGAGLKGLMPKMMARSDLMKKMKSWLYAYVAITAEQEPDARAFFKEDTDIYYIPIAPDSIYRKLGKPGKYEGAIYVGRLDERQKKLDFMIRALERVKDIHSDVEDMALLKIIGDGPDRAHYEGMVDDLDLDGNVEFKGTIVGEELVKEYNDAKFFVSTSEWESPGRTFLEAMACGLPLLVNTSNNALMEYKRKERLVRDGYNGLVYEYEDIEDFEQKFYSMYTDEGLRGKLADNAHEYVQKFSLDKVMDNYKEIIDSAVGG